MSSPTATLAQSSGGGGYSGGGYHSGGWYVDHYEAAGHRVYKLYANSPQPTDSPWATGPLVSSSGLGFPVQGVSASTSGSVVAVFVWGGDPQQVPKKVYARVSSGASASVVSNNQGLIPPDPSNGFHDPITGTDSKSTSGVHLVQKDNSGLATTVRLDPVSLSASTPNGNAGVTIAVAPDTREVMLSNPTNMKAPAYNADGSVSFDANGDENFVPMPHIAVDGVMHGDTVYGYMMGYGEVPNWQSFSANFAGNWHWKSRQDENGNTAYDVPDVVDPDTWSWSPGEGADTWDRHKAKMPWAQNFSEDTALRPHGNGDAAQEYDVSYTATDNTDGATATAKYVMMVHDPYEKNYPDHRHSVFVNPRQVSRDLISSGPQDQLGGGEEVAIEYSLSASAVGPISEWVAYTLGINLEASVSRTFNTVSNVSTTGVPAGWYTFIVEFDHYYDHLGKLDHWSPGGYVGTDPYSIREIPSVEPDRYGLQMATPQQGEFGGGGGH